MKIQNLIDKVTKGITLLFIISYGVGFLVWNLYLGYFGFFEYNFLQTRFLSSGITTLIIIGPCLVILFVLLNKLITRTAIIKFYISYFVITLIIFMIFVACIFPRTHQYLGGGRPFTKSIIAKTEEIEFLSNFNIAKVENANKDSVQTGFVCEIYSNQDVMIIGSAGPTGDTLRVLILKKDLFEGFQVHPLFLQKIARNTLCKKFIFNYSDLFLNLGSILQI